jgi:toxin ParE1/3/4
MHQAFVFLAENPFVSNERYEFDPPVLIHLHGKHLIVYTVEGNFILIVRVLHQRMDLSRLQIIAS